MLATEAILGAAAGVGFGHAVLPDHWVPLAVLGRTQHYPLSRVARLSLLAAVTHVLVSLVLGAILVVIGLQFRTDIEHAQSTIVGLLLLGTGVAFAAVEISGRGHGHRHSHPDGGGEHHLPSGEHDHPPSRLRSLGAIVVPFGAAASPDLTILPVFLAASTAGTGIAVGSLAAFAAVTIVTIVGLTVSAAASGYRIRSGWLDRWGNAITAGVLIVIGALVLAGVI